MDCFCWTWMKLETKILDLLLSSLFSINENIGKSPKEVSILLLEMPKQTGPLLKGGDIPHTFLSFLRWNGSFIMGYVWDGEL